MEDVGKLYGHLANCTYNWYIMWPFSIFYGHLENFSRFGKLNQEKFGKPALDTARVLGFHVKQLLRSC
jgi:hypothetical protein